MKDNGKVEVRTPVGGNPRVQIRITDPDGVGPYWIFGGPDAGAPLERVGNGNCANAVTITLPGPQHLNHAHYVAYNDCQTVPAAEYWILDDYFSEWTEGERVRSSSQAASFPEQISRPTSSGLLVGIALALVAFVMLSLAWFAGRRD